jgi:Tfp pilus assembly pilus retraction ATPase PilT
MFNEPASPLGGHCGPPYGGLDIGVFLRVGHCADRKASTTALRRSDTQAWAKKIRTSCEEVLLFELLEEDQVALLQTRKDIDFAYEMPNQARFRSNAFMERKGMGVFPAHSE